MAEPDLRAEVLAGLDRKSHEITSLSLYADDLPPLAKDTLTALRHLRAIVERHDGEMVCRECQVDLPCPTLLSLAPDYAPQALKEMEVEK